MSDNLEKLTEEDLYEKTGLDPATKRVINVLDGNVYIVLSPVEHDDDSEGCAASVIGSDDVSDTLQLVAWGMLELLSTEPELLVHAGSALLYKEQEQLDENPTDSGG